MGCSKSSNLRNLIRGNGIHDMNISMECNNVNVNESFKQYLLEGKYDQMWVMLLFI